VGEAGYLPTVQYNALICSYFLDGVLAKLSNHCAIALLHSSGKPGVLPDLPKWLAMCRKPRTTKAFAQKPSFVIIIVNGSDGGGY
jgi:hypothetical protein